MPKVMCVDCGKVTENFRGSFKLPLCEDCYDESSYMKRMSNHVGFDAIDIRSGRLCLAFYIIVIFAGMLFLYLIMTGVIFP